MDCFNWYYSTRRVSTLSGFFAKKCAKVVSSGEELKEEWVGKASEQSDKRKEKRKRASAKKTAVNIDDLRYRRGRTGRSKETSVGCFTVCLLRAVGLIVKSKKHTEVRELLAAAAQIQILNAKRLEFFHSIPCDVFIIRLSRRHLLCCCVVEWIRLLCFRIVATTACCRVSFFVFLWGSFCLRGITTDVRKFDAAAEIIY